MSSMAFSSWTYALITGGLLSLGISAGAQQVSERRTPTSPRVTLPDTEVRTLKSSTTGRSYDLYIHLPADYARNKEKKYPVLYVLDGQWDFQLLVSVYGGLFYDRWIPEMIIVGVTYSGSTPIGRAHV